MKKYPPGLTTDLRKYPTPLFKSHFTSLPLILSPQFPLIKENKTQTCLIDLYGHSVFLDMRGLCPRCKMWLEKRDRVRTSERHWYFNDRERLLKGKDLKNYVAITEKSYYLNFAFWLRRTFLLILLGCFVFVTKFHKLKHMCHTNKDENIHK